MMIDWERIRSDFPVTERVVYLNTAGGGPIARSVADAAARFYREMMEEGDAYWDEWLARREEIRRRVAAFINAEPEEIGFTTNTSSGMNLIVDALAGRGEVVSCDLEFPVSTIPWMHRKAPVHLINTTDGVLNTEDVRRAVNERTGIISISHVQYSNGFRADLEELGGAKGDAKLVVNASQSAGAFQIDVRRMRIDALCASGHKWMLAGYGSGFVYMSRELLAETRPRLIGWMSVENPFGMDNKSFVIRPEMAARAELGCPHFAGIFALGASLDYMSEIGLTHIEQRVLALNRYLTERLTESGWRVLSPLQDERMRSGETLLQASRPKRLVAHLAHRGIAVTEKPQGIRIATHFFNNEEEIEQLIEALDEVQKYNAPIEERVL
ncbi:MAG TPA: aminotransferase class V-fold PLP-dependent enzyme [Pyrinomonadaceae bacterium]|jgi:selenocysteine lyase/cysteine desulfurase|nr:aminotransferase class V-fold PLP-dependent enzyme [Pyrinomonadaceae bacterium]